MENQSDVTEAIRQLEERLLQPKVRSSVEVVSKLLADDFIEHGSSGRIYDKKQVIEGLKSEDSVQTSLSDFEAKTMAAGIILTTYRAIQHNHDGQQSHSLRSSVWKLIDGNWQMIFHQGTPMPHML